MQQSPWPFFFGDWNNPLLWAVSLTPTAVPFPGFVALPRGQVIFVLPLDTPVQWRAGDAVGSIDPGSLGLFDTSRGLPCELAGGSRGGLLIGMRSSELVRMLEPFRPGLAAEVRDLLYGTCTRAVLPARPEILAQVIPALRDPAVSGVARAFWYESQFKSLLALSCFVPAKGESEFFCSRQKRLARVRVARAKARLNERLDDALDLNRLAAEVGCSASYLSRTFSATTGMTISQYLRKCRIEKAAGLLVTGRYNVSEVAVEVGYQSLSHFSKAFQQVKGCLPSRYEAA